MKTGMAIVTGVALTISLLSLQSIIAQNPPKPGFSVLDRRPAIEILREAGKRCVKENKNILVVVGASWCGACPLLTEKLAQEPISGLLSRNFVLVKLDGREAPENKQLENPGVMQLLEQWTGPALKYAGVPYFVILDSKLKLQADCLKSNYGTWRSMIGFSGERGDFFVELMGRTAKNLKPGELESLQKWVDDGGR